MKPRSRLKFSSFNYSGHRIISKCKTSIRKTIQKWGEIYSILKKITNYLIKHVTRDFLLVCITLLLHDEHQNYHRSWSCDRSFVFCLETCDHIKTTDIEQWLFKSSRIWLRVLRDKTRCLNE